MEEEIATLKRDRMKPYYSINTVSEALPALGIVAAVLGIVKALVPSINRLQFWAD